MRLPIIVKDALKLFNMILTIENAFVPLSDHFYKEIIVLHVVILTFGMRLLTYVRIA